MSEYQYLEPTVEVQEIIRRLSLHKKATIHQVITMLWCSGNNQNVGSLLPVVSRWL